MAVSFVQIGDGAGVVTLGASTPVDNLLLVLWIFDGTFSSLADNLPNTYTQLGSEVSTDTLKGRAYWAKNATAGVRTVTGTVTGGTFNALFVVEYTRQHLVTPVDVSSLVAYDNRTTDYTDSVTLSRVNEMLVGFGSSSTGAVSIVTAGYNNRSINQGSTVDDLLHAASGLKSVTWTNSSFPTASDNLSILVAIQPPADAIATPFVGGRTIYKLAPQRWG